MIALLAACTADGPTKDGAPTDDPAPADHTGGTDPTTPTSPVPHTGAPADHTAAPPEDPVVFVAQGDVGRWTVSCDGGRTWPVNTSRDDAFRCFVDGDCDHDPGAGRGIAYGDGAFVATWGWGFPGALSRLGPADDAFATTLPGHTFAGVAFDGGVFLASERPPVRSTDGGATWTDAGDVTSDQWNVRRTGAGEGLFLVAFDSGATDLNVSDDGGVTFRRPTTWPAACGASIQWEGGIAVRGGVAVVVGGDGTACASTDGGDTWTATDLGGPVSGRLVVTARGFETWGAVGYVPQRFSSSDGVTWTAEPTTVRAPDGTPSAGPPVGAVAVGPDGTYVAVNAGWDRWYEDQRFYRSDDGVTWDELPAGAFTGSHPIRFVAAGRSATPLCAR